MLRIPLKLELKEIVSVTMIDSPETCAELAPIEHWLFESVAVEVIDFVVEPVRLSYSSWMVLRDASYTRKHELVSVELLEANAIAVAFRFAGFCESAKTN